MALIYCSINCTTNFEKPSIVPNPTNPNSKSNFSLLFPNHTSTSTSPVRQSSRRFFRVTNNNNNGTSQEDEDNSLGVKAALSMLKFYKREISPLLPNSCRYQPTCSEYSMIAYKKYGVAKGTVLTAWRLCRCNPLGGSGFDPPRWFDETTPPEE